jgi:flagellar M-ring protein FliF
LESDGTLEAAGMTYEEFKQANMASIELPVDQNTIDLIVMSTGIDNVKVTAYEIPKFEDKIVEKSDWTKYLPIALAAIIFVFLAFVVYKGTKPVEISDIDAGLSVEDLLTSTRESQIPKEEIPMDDLNETRKMIEKFVEDKPEAAAQLLRNWLNEGWE